MVHRGADDGQAQGDVDALVKSQHLGRDVPLIVVHGHHRIVLPLVHAEEDRVRRDGAHDVHTLGAGGLSRWADLQLLLVPEQTAFPGVGVQSGQRQPGLRDAHAAHGGVGQARHLQDALLLDAFDGLAQRHVRADVADAKAARGEQHGDLLYAAQVR